MKAQIHPNWYPQANVTCACGNSFVIGSTVPQIHVEVCSKCHPFFTGKMKFVDTKGRIDKFMAKRELAVQKPAISKKERRAILRKQKLEEELSRPTTLEELRLKKTSK